MQPVSRPLPYWLDHWRNVRKVLWALYAACAVLIGLDFLYVKHTAFGFEGWFGFYGVYGFVCCVALVLIAGGRSSPIGRPQVSFRGTNT